MILGWTLILSAAAQANAIPHASGEILVFTDLTAELAGCIPSEEVGLFSGLS